jgi:hypothetical protein
MATNLSDDSAQPNITITQQGTITPAVLAGAAGLLQTPDIALSDGDNTFTLMAIDPSGDSTERNLAITQQDTITADVPRQWNRQSLEVIGLMVADPPLVARVLAMVNLAQYHTMAAIDGTPGALIDQTVTGPVSVDASLAKAAHTVLYAMLPPVRTNFDTSLNALLSSIPDGSAMTNALTPGRSIGNGILSETSDDGSDAQSVNEIQSRGSATASTRMAGQSQISQFWPDSKGSDTPVVYWDQVAKQIAISAGISLSSSIRLFAELNVAMADSGMAATIADSNWTPLPITSFFPEYKSGHSMFSTAAFTHPGVTPSLTNFTQAAQKARRRRVYSGIHYEYISQVAQQPGKRVAAAVLDRFALSKDLQPSATIADPAAAPPRLPTVRNSHSAKRVSRFWVAERFKMKAH